MAGVRLGWLATRDRGLLERLKQSKDYTTICGNGTVSVRLSGDSIVVIGRQPSPGKTGVPHRVSHHCRHRPSAVSWKDRCAAPRQSSACAGVGEHGA
jgi:hypothetical protein